MPSKHPEYGDSTYLIFLVDDILFHLPIRHLKQSQYFRDMLEEAHTGSEGEGMSDEHPIFLSGISAFEMASFLKAIESPFIYGDPGLNFSEWAAALHLATMWNFDRIRERVIEQMDKTISSACPLDRIDASLKCRVKEWLHPAYEDLCKRTTTLSDLEAERLGLRRSAAIWRIREWLLSRQISSPPSHHSSRRFTSRSNRPLRGFFDDEEDEEDEQVSLAATSNSLSLRGMIEGEEALKFP